MTRETPGADSDRSSVVYERFGVTVHHGDCLDVLAEMTRTATEDGLYDKPEANRFVQTRGEA